MRWRCADDIYRRAPFNMSPKGAICMHDIDSIHFNDPQHEAGGLSLTKYRQNIR